VGAGTPYTYVIGPSPIVFPTITIDNPAATFSIDPSSVGSVFTPFRYAGVPTDLGTSAINLQPAQTGFGNSATGNNCIVIGNGSSKCSGVGGIVIGGGSAVTQAQSIAIGASAVNGSNLTFLTGTGPNDNGAQGHRVHATNFIAAAGDSQVGDFQLKGLTTNATPTVLTSNTSGTSSTGHIGDPAINSANMGSLRCLARDTGTGDVGAWYDPNVVLVKGANAAATVLKLSALVSVFADIGAATWTLASVADTTVGGMKLTFTGEAAKTIHVLCSYGPLVELK